MEKSAPEDSILELEHAIGFSGKIVRSVYIHPNGKEFVYISGACIVICDISDPHKQSFLREHDNQITCLAISNNGKLIASGQLGENSDVIIWDYEFQRSKFKLSEHDHMIQCVEFSHDDRLLFSCGSAADNKIFIWDTSNGYIVASTTMLPNPIVCARWGGFVKDIKWRDTNRYQMAVTGNKQICLWKIDSLKGIMEHEMINTGSMIRDYVCIEFSKSREDYLFAGTTSGDFCVFQMKNKVLACVVNVCALGVISLRTLTTDLMVVGGGNGTVASFKINIEAGSNSSLITPGPKIALTGCVNSLSFPNDVSQVMAATDRGFIYRLRPTDLASTLHCENHTDSVLYVAYPPKVSDRFASCSEDGTIRLWDVSEYQVTSRCLAPGAGSPQCLTFNEEVLVSGWADGKIRMFKTESGQLIWQIDNAHKGGVSAILLSSNLKFIVSGGVQGEVRVWELRSREMVCNLKEHTAKVTNIYLLPNDLYLVSASRDKAILTWDLKNEKRIAAHIQRMGAVNSFDVVPNSSTILSTGQDRKITYWDMNQTNAIKSLDTSTNPKAADECYCLAVSHNGKLLATGGSMMTLRLWDIATGKCLSEGKGHSGVLNYLAFSYDDKQVVTAGKDGCLFLWNIFL